MRAYRDQYASVFNEGRNVVLMAISTDSVEEITSWLKDEDFPYVGATDAGGEVFQSYGGGLRENGTVDSRTVIVVGPDGNVASVIPSFNQVDPAAYDELAEVIDRVTPTPEDG